MAYQRNDPYYSSPTSYNHQNNFDYPPTSGAHAYSTDMPPAGNAGNYPHGGYSDYDSQSGWNNKSTKSFNTYHGTYADSQAHLNPQYEMSQVAPPLPSMPYSQPGYPPGSQLRPPLREQSTGGWSHAREKLMKRRSVRQVELFQGNLVLDVPVPSHIVPKGSGSPEEMTTMRYTAATCDPE